MTTQHAALQVPNWLHLALALIVVASFALLATALFSGPSEALAFDITMDPSGARLPW